MWVIRCLQNGPPLCTDIMLPNADAGSMLTSEAGSSSGCLRPCSPGVASWIVISAHGICASLVHASFIKKNAILSPVCESEPPLHAAAEPYSQIIRYSF